MPDIYGSGKASHIGIRNYSHNEGSGLNQVGVSQLLNRKKSYERMMRIDEVNNGQNNGRSELHINSTNKPRISVVGGSNAKRRMSTLEVQGNSGSQKRLHNGETDSQTLDITGKNLQRGSRVA